MLLNIKVDQSKLEQESAIFKCASLTKYMKSINEASLALVQEDVSLLQNKGELFDMAKRKVHEMGYSYAKQSSRSKVFREERINELYESITSTNETIQLLLKQKEQYANIDKLEQAADVNTT